MLGVLVGLDSVPRREWHAPRALRALRLAAHALVWLAGAALLLAWAGDALPPLALIGADLGALVARLRGLAAGIPGDRTLVFVRASTARLAADLAAAPEAGARGASLLLGEVGTLLTWAGGLMLGRGLALGRGLVPYAFWMLAALTVTAVVGDAGGLALASGTFAILTLVSAAAFGRRRLAWDRAGMDYSTELGRDVLFWSGVVTIGALLLAWIVPLWPGNPIAQALARSDSPSGIAALERGISRPVNPNPPVDVGLSTLPSVQLGISLQRGPPDQLALRVHLDAPLPPGPLPRYWRARVLNRYNGVIWFADARVASQEPNGMDASAVEGGVAQEVEDLRGDKTLIVGLPDIIDVSIPTSIERFPDGAQAAITGRPPVQRYRVVSRVQELAPLPPSDRPPPDMSAYLSMPSGLPPRVRELAVAVAGNEPTARAKALALESYLRALPYSYQVEPVPEQGDAVDQFLFNMRSGYCTYYASAMTIMARSLGIPARVAVGYSTGVEDQPGVYVVREADAHAWPELYIGNRWEPFEPTPIRPLPSRTTAEETTQVEIAAPEAAPDRVRGPLIWAAVLVVMVVGGLALWRLGRRPPPPTALARAQLALERWGERLGVAWPPGATIQEYAQLLEGRTGDARPALRELVVLVQHARYGAHHLDADEERRLLAAEERVESNVKF
jgi:transglutaminase-like putative cysteine protease